MGFLVENLTHDLNINGKREKVACLKMYGEACPICELSARFYDKNSAEFNEELGKQFYRKKSYIGQVLVIETPVDHDAEQLVKLIDFGPQVFKQIQAAFQSGDLDEAPYELKGGYNFRFRKTKTGSGQNSYTTSNFATKQSDVADNVIETMVLYSLADYRTPKTERAAVEAMLVAVAQAAKANSNFKSVKKELIELGRIVGNRLASRDATPVKLFRGNHKPGTETVSSARARAASAALAAAGTQALAVTEAPATRKPTGPKRTLAKVKTEAAPADTAKVEVSKTAAGATVRRVPVAASSVFAMGDAAGQADE